MDVIRLLGEHDLATRERLREEVERSIAADRGIVVSLVNAEYIDSGVINALFKTDRALRERGRRLVLHVNTASIVRFVLDISGASKAFPCSGDVEAAVALASERGSDSSWSSA